MEANQYPLPDIDDAGNMNCPDGFAATQPAGNVAPDKARHVLDQGTCTAAATELRGIKAQGNV